jgi:prepilin-type processing-associated H-X9-DG protein
VQSPAQKIQVAEDNAEWDLEPRDGGQLINRHFTGHLGTGNYLYYDGHVKAQRAVSTGAPFNQWGRGEGTECDAFTGENAINCDIVQPQLVARLNTITDKYK